MSLQTQISVTGVPSEVTTPWDSFAAPATSIPVTTTFVSLVPTAAATVTATPSIATTNVVAGTRVTLFGASAFATIVQDAGTLAGSQLKLQSSTRTISQYQALVLVFDGTFWCEESFSASGGGSGGGAVTLAQQLFVAKNGNDASGDGSLSKPYLTISRALTDANAGAANTYYRINVSPGTYIENLSITKQRILIVGASTAPDQLFTTVQGTVTVNNATSTDRFSDVMGFSGLLITSTAASPAFTITGAGSYQVNIDNCYITTNQTGQNAIYCNATNVNRPIIYLRNSVVTKVTAGATVAVILLDRGDCRMDTVRVYASVTGAGAGIALNNNATLLADRLQVEKLTSGPGIDVNVNTSSIGCTITNSSIATQYVGALTAPCLNLNNATGVAGYVWQCLFVTYDLAGNNAIDGTFNGATPPLIVGNLAYGPGPSGTNSTIAAAVNAAKSVMTVLP